MNAPAKLTDQKDGTLEDWQIIVAEMAPFNAKLPERILSHLNLLGEDCGGFQVSRLTHSLQTATRALRDGRDEEYIVCALLHDIGDMLGSYNHSDSAAAILKPFVSEANHWMVEPHGIFQGYYFFHHVGLDRNMREQYRSSPHYVQTAEFCAKYDAPAFDPAYETLPLEHFEPMVRNVFAKPKRSIYLRTPSGATS